MKLLRLTFQAILVCLLLILPFLFITGLPVFAKQDVKRTLDSYIKTFFENHHIPGASVAIVHDNEIFYSNEWGITGESEEKVTIETPFLLGSLSKSLTGLAILKLIDKDVIHIDDRVQKYVPWFTLKNKQAASQITIKHLLSHTSGLSTYSGLLIADQGSKDFNAIKNNVKSLSNEELTASPGAKYQYSDANYLILGALIEEVSKQRFSEFMQQHIFLPLHMQNSAADYESAYKKGYLSGYQSWFGTPIKSKVSYDNGGAPYGYISSSAKDMVQYINLISQKDNSNFISPENLNLFLSPLIQSREDRYYGFGWNITPLESKENMIWHSGSTPDSRSEIFFLSKTGWAGVILTNKNHFLEEEALANLRNSIVTIINGEKPEDIPKHLSIIQLVALGILLLFIVLFIYLIVKVKLEGILKRKAWRFFGIILLVLSFSIIPLLIYSVSSPWHSINLFAPDVAFLIKIMLIFLAVNGLLSIYISFKQSK